MDIHFHGAARTTTGSMHLLEHNGSRVLLDCGLYQGKRKIAFERNRNLPFPADSIDACVLSHAHIDHSGNIPTLVKNGFEGPVVCTSATRDLCEIMLQDSGYLQEKDVEYVNKKRRKQGKNLFEPLYTVEDAVRCMKNFQPVQYRTPTEVVPGLTVAFHDAGHILGSGLVTVDFSRNGSSERLLFTGDLGRRNMPILRDPTVVDDVDYLLTESTYGNRLHPPRKDIAQRLLGLCRKIQDRSSRLVIPAFSVGRTQQLLYFLHELWADGELTEIPVYVDSPLSTKATGVYEDHPECYDQETMSIIKNHEEPFSFSNVRFTEDVEESKSLNHMDGPLIIISASGMCEGGRILHHLKNTVEDDRNVILIVGYQAEHTLGRRIVKEKSPIKIFGDEYALRAEVHSIQALSAHADREEMMAYFDDMGLPVNRALVVHGEMEQARPVAEELEQRGVQDVTIPKWGQTVSL